MKNCWKFSYDVVVVSEVEVGDVVRVVRLRGWGYVFVVFCNVCVG